MYGSTLLPFIVVAGLSLIGCSHDPSSQPEIGSNYPQEEQGALKSSPRVLYHGDTLTLAMPAHHPQGLAIKTPADDWYYLQDPTAASRLMAKEDFARLTRLEIPTAELQAIRWVGGRAEKAKVFTQTGEYLIYMADNLETEPENTFHFMTTVYYYDRPRTR